MAKEFKKDGMSGSGPVSGGSTSGTKGNGGPSIGGDAVGKGASAGLGAIGAGVSTMIDNQNTINNLMNLASELHSGIMTTLIGLDITQFRDFNDKNGEVMRFHMMRNAIMKELLHDGVGAGAYIDGNPYNDGTPVPDYSYSHNYSYRMFSGNVHIAENNGQLTTSHRDINDGSVTNKFFDYERNGSSNASTNGALQANVTGISGTGSNIDKDSLLYKTKRLFQANKINSIISQFHTSQNVRYDGQVGSDKYGESHGRNLLTKSAENGGAANMYNGFDNPYCRVWTHHYTYDRLSKTMRAHPMGSSIENSINYWGKEFEWNENDVGHTEDKTNYGDGEKYDYAWRGHHNQQRRRANSVLDESTGLVTIAPKFDGGGPNNVHTKACMFSIENLAWKDYDPYSFEQALSWEQRGPLGGRIMWFPPYNLKVTETNTAKWSQNEFIGRGESVYTYVNSERSGTLTFTMLVDHPSSIDYASWHDTSGVHSDNDYHRYFAGCFDGGTGMDGKGIDKENYGDVINNKNGVISPNGGDNLLEVPTNLTDEYTRQVPNKIQAREHVEQPEIQEEPPRTTPTQVIPEPEPPKYVEFYTFFPNNYSGVYDRPLINENQDKEYTQVDAILYLLMGNGAQKKDGFEDLPLSISNLQNVKSGYEMTTALGQNTDGNYVNGYANGTNGYVISSTKKWYYRIDSHLKKKKWTDSKKVVHEYGYATDNLESTNTIGQSLLHKANYTDAKSYKLNSDITHIKSSKLSSGDNLYSFSDIACAMYSEKLLNNTTIYEYLKNHSDSKNVEELINIFTTMKLTNIECSGSSNEHGANASKTVNQQRNQVLADNRGKTLISWLRQFANFANAPITKTSYAGVEVAPEDKSNENGLTAKLNRNAHIKLEFSSIEVKSESQTTPEIDESEETRREILSQLNQKADILPSIGNDFNDNDWLLIDVYGVKIFIGNGYEYLEENKGNVQWDGDASGIKFIVNGKSDKSSVEKMFNSPEYPYKNTFSKDVVYKSNDICFYNNNFYVSRFDFHTEDTKYKDENNDIKLKNLQQNEYKNYHGFRYLGSKEVGDAQWHYYLKEPGMTYFEEDNSINENTKSNSDKPTDDNIEISLSQLKTVFNSEPFQPSSAKYVKNQNINNTQTTTTPSNNTSDIKDAKYKGEFSNDYNNDYHIGDVVKKDDKYYECIVDMSVKYPKHSFENDMWKELKSDTDEGIREINNFVATDYHFVKNDGVVIFNPNDVTSVDGVWKICSEKFTDRFSFDDWDPIPEVDTTGFEVGKYYHDDENVFKCIDDTIYDSEDYDDRNWEGVHVEDFIEGKKYHINDVVKYNNVFCVANKDNGDVRYTWNDDIKVAVPSFSSDNNRPDGEFSTQHDYVESDICLYQGKYYVAVKDSDKGTPIEWSDDDWIEFLAFNKYDNYILEKIGLMTCKGLPYVITEFGFDGPQYRYSLDTVSNEFKTYTLYGRDVDDKTKSYDTIYKDEKIINTKVNLVDVANEHIDSIYGAEDKRVQDVYSSLGFSNADEMKKYISLINILEHVDYIVDKDGNRTPVCQTEEQMEKLMIERKNYDQNADAYEKDCNNVWVDTGDGLLIKECELTEDKKTKNLNRNKSLNKLRYDQEYHFYKKYMADHPFVLEKLREKIKYFNPAFHSMTPEGINGRLTFLNQCTRQGATMTRSDALAGTTANNLAFGRPPFCVLRLGDFYHQMIVIESINYNYDVSGGLQWDLNTEGNGVQPMLCEVSISFKFIGGGDITGPVRRLQNAMSFNYYANTSFYDNRADRAEYQDTNWETMGGGGNNKVDANKSYSYLPNLYEDTDNLINITRL